MRRFLAIILFPALLLAGCASSSPVAVITARGVSAPPNMVFGPRIGSTALATRMTARAKWPSVDTGFRFNDVTHYTRSTYDYQHGYDANQGVFHESYSVEEGVHVR